MAKRRPERFVVTRGPTEESGSRSPVYAIINDGAHQYRVEEGQTFEVHLKDVEEGVATVEFDRVLLVGDIENGPRIGSPVVKGAKVIASVVGPIKGDKITIRKHRRRKNYSLKKGHRQKFLQVRVDKIEDAGAPSAIE